MLELMTDIETFFNRRELYKAICLSKQSVLCKLKSTKNILWRYSKANFSFKKSFVKSIAEAIYLLILRIKWKQISELKKLIILSTYVYDYQDFMLLVDTRDGLKRVFISVILPLSKIQIRKAGERKLLWSDFLYVRNMMT